MICIYTDDMIYYLWVGTRTVARISIFIVLNINLWLQVSTKVNLFGGISFYTLPWWLMRKPAEKQITSCYIETSTRSSIIYIMTIYSPLFWRSLDISWAGKGCFSEVICLWIVCLYFIYTVLLDPILPFLSPPLPVPLWSIMLKMQHPILLSL